MCRQLDYNTSPLDRAQPQPPESDPYDQTITTSVPYISVSAAKLKPTDNQTDFPDRGGTYVSVPLNYFNDSGGWKRKFKKHSFFVAMCQTSNPHTQRHTVKLLYDAASSAFEMQESAFVGFHLMWTSHGKPEIPMYEIDPKAQVDGAMQFLCNFMQEGVKRRKKPVKPKDRHHDLRVDLEELDTDKDLARRRNLARTGRAANEFINRFDKALYWIVFGREGYAWGSAPGCDNSCHLDVWLMEEFAMLSDMCTTEQGSLLMKNTVTGPDKDMAMARLLKVLLSIHEPDRERLKNAYWLMEIEKYNASLVMGRFAMYTEHATILSEQSASRDDSVHVACDIVCSNPLHTLEPKIGRQLVNWIDEWYHLPAHLTRVNLGPNAEGQVQWDHEGRQGRVQHTGVKDLLFTLIARSDMRRAQCLTCISNNVVPAPYLRSVKKPLRAGLPKFLRVHVAGRMNTSAHPANLEPDEAFNIGEWEYELYSCIFGNQTHFISNICLGMGNTMGRAKGISKKVWYHYDGMGFRGQTNNAGKKYRLKKIRDPETSYWLPWKAGYVALSYRYMRFDPPGRATMAHVSPVGDESQFPTNEEQYQSMNSVLDSADLVPEIITVDSSDEC